MAKNPSHAKRYDNYVDQSTGIVMDGVIHIPVEDISCPGCGHAYREREQVCKNCEECDQCCHCEERKLISSGNMIILIVDRESPEEEEEDSSD